MAFAVWTENSTPFVVATNLQLDADGQEVFVAIFSATFSSNTNGDGLLPDPEQLPINLGDVPFGNPALSSNRYESDIVPFKPGADIIVNGTARVPNGKPVRQMQVGLKVGAIRKVLAVLGDRAYEAGGYSSPNPFTAIPIVYERAYGGTAADGTIERRNPVGVGYKQARSADATVNTEAPNVIYAGEPFQGPLDRPKPAGFGTIGRGWLPRLPLAGTYDQTWLDTQWPLPPKDFDARYNLCAPVDQQLPSMPIGETVSLIGLTPEGRWDFRIPEIVAPIRLLYDDRAEDHPFRADTLIIEPDRKRITLKARLSIVTKRNAPALREIVFGHVSPGFLLARRKGKDYFSPQNGDGRLRDRPDWRG